MSKAKSIYKSPTKQKHLEPVLVITVCDCDETRSKVVFTFTGADEEETIRGNWTVEQINNRS